MSKEYGPDAVVTFTVDVGYVGCIKEEKFTLEDLGIVDEGETISEEVLEKELEEAYENWVWENINCNHYVEEG
ncbi:hypothetical protein BSP38_166 [Bacillus phage BSP38]|uniref:Uncharacterized protein n=1 Tax=Bacillus phage BSP38 TaxID=2283013 RepID=A0A345MK26_BPBSP|nr:hypothetical protein HWB82_gp152 [Bacillus phage BSP38]AXH71208.1 hypothetical protein BSP38_166 [Bacillus phage BSP38]